MRKFPTKLLLAIKQAYVVNYYFYAILINAWDGDFLWRYIKSVSFFITNWKLKRSIFACLVIYVIFHSLTFYMQRVFRIMPSDQISYLFLARKKIFEDTKWFVANKRRLCIKASWSRLVSQSMTLEKTVLNTVYLFYFYFCGLSRWLKVHPAGPHHYTQISINVLSV